MMQVDDLGIFFCIGAAKSGTTLLARALDQHPRIACIWESYAFHPRSQSSIFNPTSDRWQHHGFSEADVRRWADIWRAQPQALARRVLRRLTGKTFFVSSSFRRTMPDALADFARRTGATVVGDKWPWYAEHIDTVTEVFPNAHYIYNVRDPRGLWNSAQRFKGRQRGDELLARMLRQERLLAPHLSRPNFCTIRYEDLASKPEGTCRYLYNLLGQDYDPAYLRYDATADPYPDRWDWVPEASEQFDPWHAVKWQEQMAPNQIERVTAMAKSFIQKYGYEETR